MLYVSESHPRSLTYTHCHTLACGCCCCRFLCCCCCRGAPLYLGSLRTRPPGRYSALLCVRPERPGPGALAVIGSALCGREPRFSLLMGGTLVTLCERDGLFKCLLMWLQAHAVERDSLLGGRCLSDDALGGLSTVLGPTQRRPPVQQRVLGWWFPAPRY